MKNTAGRPAGNGWTLACLSLLAPVLAACGGSFGDGSAVACDSIAGGDSQLTASCANGCTIVNAAAAADGDLRTSADITPNPGTTSETASLRATAQTGIVYPVGSRPGVMLTQPDFDNTVNDVVTYLDGIEQERMSGNPSTAAIEPGGGDAAAYFTFTATKQFDAVEFLTTNSWSSGSPIYPIYEICSNGGA